jgi:hypothetical protein
MPKGKPLGPRVSVVVGQVKNSDGKNVPAISFMLESTANLFGFTPARANELTRRTRSGSLMPVRGAKGNAIKVPTGKKRTTRSGKVDQLVSIPMPGGMTIPKIRAFLKKARSRKPDYFVTSDGYQHSTKTT